MKFYISHNSPGTFYMAQGSMDSELQHADACYDAPVVLLSWLNANVSNFKECPAYPGTFHFYCDWEKIPFPREEEVKTSREPREIKHLTYSLGDILKGVL